VVGASQNVSDLIRQSAQTSGLAWVDSRLLVGQSSNCSEDGISRERWSVARIRQAKHDSTTAEVRCWS